ncbi:MAG: S1 RNA-binding domain-containing protein [bacterium]|nr:S1 RNA-binding domain-containing protein [bacterium]
MKSKHVGRDRQQSGAFAQMLEVNLKQQAALNPGDYQNVRITSTNDRDFVFVSTEEHGPGVIRREELLDSEGQINVSAGEKLDAFYLDTQGGEKVFTTRPSGRAANEIVATAFRDSIPLRGKIARQIKGGFEIQLGEVLAFCPASQMEDEELGRQSQGMEYLVTEHSGKRVIASRRSFKDRKREYQKDILMGTLQEGDIITGTVISLQNFGAFVDLGGVEGLIPISELDFTRVNHPSQVVKTGESVRVKVIAIDWKEDRITLSRRAMLQNPWQGELPFREGEIVAGTIESLKDFGAFVRLTDNFTGLIPMSESGVPRGQRIESAFERGQEIRVMVARIDRERERISLSYSKVAEADSRAEYEEYMESQKDDIASGTSSFGQQLLDAMNKKKQ